ncbi:MAG: hypothetical protein P8X68_10310 [Desulfobacterales bacterium]
MRKPIYLIFFTIVLLMKTGNLAAADLKNGFFDLAWGTNLSQLEGFVKISENLNITYFINNHRAYTIADIKITDVIYGSFENQFFAVYIDTAAINVFAQVKRYISHKYGLPNIIINQMQNADQLTTYQWKYAKTKIKLKMHANRENMKMAFYYTPLSGQVNETQMELFEETHKKSIFPLNKSQIQQAEQVRSFLQF